MKNHVSAGNFRALCGAPIRNAAHPQAPDCARCAKIYMKIETERMEARAKAEAQAMADRLNGLASFDPSI